MICGECYSFFISATGKNNIILPRNWLYAWKFQKKVTQINLVDMARFRPATMHVFTFFKSRFKRFKIWMKFCNIFPILLIPCNICQVDHYLVVNIMYWVWRRGNKWNYGNKYKFITHKKSLTVRTYCYNCFIWWIHMR